MDPIEIEDKPPVIDNLPGDIGEAAFALLDKDAPPPAPARRDDPPPPPPPPRREEPPAPPRREPQKPPAAKPVELDPLSPEALAAAAPKKDDGGMPADLLKDADIERFSDRKQREAFVKERAAHKEARQRLQELSQKVNELSSKAQDAEQLAEIRKQLEARDAEAKRLEAEIAKIDLSRSPEFRKRYDDRLNQLGRRMVDALAAEGVPAEEASRLVRGLVAERRPSARESALDEAAPSLKGTLLAFLTQFDETAQERQTALDKAKETAAAIGEAESRARLAAMAGQVDSAADKAVAEAVALGSPYYKEVAGNDEWNAAIKERVQTLKGLLLSQDPEKLAPFVAEGITAADTRRRYAELFKRFKELEAEHAKVIGSSPPFGRTLPADGAPPPPSRKPLNPSLGLEDAVAEALSP